MKFEEQKARIRTPAHAADELFNCNVFTSCSSCQQGEDRYFKLKRPPCKEIRCFWSGTSQCLFQVLVKYKPVCLTYLLQKAITRAVSTTGS
jgi:hypothetical protein